NIGKQAGSNNGKQQVPSVFFLFFQFISATKAKYIDDAVAALNVTLIKEEIDDLEELHVPREIVGAKPYPTKKAG
ncbi:MAG: hypothetical protein U5K84_11990, partial [Alkalibacterium sp.]|nr:hypothetical protein [Alkalibacterium sp.]